MVGSQHSRLPVGKASPSTWWASCFKDMLRLWRDRRVSIRSGRPAAPFYLRHIMRKPLIVPETKPLMQMLEEFRGRHSHMALVVDEFGTVTGLVTVEDVLEQIVGEIEDEFDEKLPPVAHADAGPVELDGATSILDFASLYGVELPVNAGFETIAGYMLFELGHIPRPGESVRFEGRRFTVTAMERNRIARVRVETFPLPSSRRENRSLLGIDARAARATWTAALVLLLLGAVYLIRQTLLVFVIALLFAYLLYPLMDLIDRHLPSKTRTPALALTFVLVIGLLATFGILIGSVVGREAANLAAAAPAFFERFQQTPHRLRSPSPRFRNLIADMIRQHYGQIVSVVPQVSLRVLSASRNLISSSSSPF